MLFKILNKYIPKIVSLTFIIYIFMTISVVSNAENYEWTVINNLEAVETNSKAEGENDAETDNVGENEIAEDASSSNVTSNNDELNLQCEAAILIEQNSGQILYEKNSHEQLRPASVTKLMTLLLIFESLESGQIKLEDRVPCSANAAAMGGSQIWLDTREELTVNEMLKAMCVVSANDYDVQFRHE